MKLCVIFLLFVVVWCNKFKKYENQKKLQVGIKFRPKECPRKVQSGDQVSVHYTGYLASDGSKFDSSVDRGTPFDFTIGIGRVIKGWDEGMMGSCEGEKRRLVIPPHKGYGERGSPPKIPANSVLVFDVEVIKINSK